MICSEVKLLKKIKQFIVNCLSTGFETSSTTMSNALYELALNPSIQDKLRKEIQEVLKKTDEKLTYDGVKHMKYLHKVFQGKLIFFI